jgi:uncharacterized protein YjiS (DUF1127 family)
MAALRATGIVQVQHNPHIHTNSTGQAKTPCQSTALLEKIEAEMAYVNVTRTSHVTLLSRVLAATAGITAALRQRQVYLGTLRELNSLSDRDMADLGIHRAMIGEIAYEAAYGRK